MEFRRAVEIVGVPFDLCGPVPGSRLGPLAVRLAGLPTGLRALGYEVTVSDLTPIDDDLAPDAAVRAERALPVYRALRDRVAQIDPDRTIPVVLGGDHSLSLGSVAGALQRHGEGLAVLWIDAHLDLNTPATTPSGNLHGMPLAALTGLPAGARPGDAPAVEGIGRVEGLWPEIGRVVGAKFVRPDRVSWLGLRDVDAGEVANLGSLPGHLALTMQHVDGLGVARCLAEVDRWLREGEARALWVSFDVDVLDPVFAPGTGTSVRGGLTYREGHLLAETLHAMLSAPDSPYRLAGLDVVEVNPLNDFKNETARVASEWVLSFLGKTILGSPDPGRIERVG